MENSDNVDRISVLPDKVLHHILSFAPIKLAFATRALSKRWVSLGYSLRDLCFDDEHEHYNKSFCRFVDRFMLFPRTDHQSIKSFHLKCTPKNIDKWVETAKRYGVEDLNLSMYYENSLAPSIFNCRTLVVMKLIKIRVSDYILSFDLPSLKTLYLEHVTFQNSDDLKNILSGCPILENLHTDIFTVNDNGFRPQGFKTLSTLLRANIHLYDLPFREIPDVQFLSIIKIKERIPSAGIDSYYQDFPVFQNLIQLELNFFHFLSWDEVVEMLQYCPMLQILVIHKWAKRSNINVHTDWVYPKSIPECFSSQLRSCSINYEGMVDELRFAAFILLNAQLLQSMTIRVQLNSLDSMQKLQLLEELSSYPRNSVGCEFSIE